MAFWKKKDVAKSGGREFLRSGVDAGLDQNTVKTLLDLSVQIDVDPDPGLFTSRALFNDWSERALSDPPGKWTESQIQTVASLFASLRDRWK